MVRLKTRYAGPKGCFSPGDLLNLPAELEDALVAGKFAERVEVEKPKEKKPDEAKVENESVEAPETATAPPMRRRRKTVEE